MRFTYGECEVLHGIELAVPSGACYAIVGESEGGKSTLAKLAARLYDARPVAPCSQTESTCGQWI